MYIDTHVHLNADRYEEDLQEVIDRALEAKVEEWWSLVLTVKPLREQCN